MINDLIGAFIQLLIFTLIPFIFFLISHKTYRGFFRRMGLYPAGRKSLITGILFGALMGIAGIVMMNFFPVLKLAATAEKTVPSAIRQLNNNGEKIAIILITALIRTSLSEEILFRGGLGKWLMHTMGYRFGNILQAFIFGMVHILLLWELAPGTGFYIFTFMVASTGAYLAAYINEKKSKGSILSGWIMHGTTNVIAYFYLSFW